MHIAGVVRSRSVGLIAALTLFGCGSRGTEFTPTDLVMVVSGGESQTGTAGELLPSLLAVRVTDRAGDPIPRYPVTFSATPDGGTVSSRNVTDLRGIAVASWTLPTRVGTYRATATSDLGTVEFVATAQAGPLAQLQLVGGGGQIAPAGQPLVDRIVVRVADQYGNGVAGTTVAFVAPLGNGTALTPLAQSDEGGIVSTGWVLGEVPGPMELRAKVANLGRIFINATATP
jgi:hypothetical protein